MMKKTMISIFHSLLGPNKLARASAWVVILMALVVIAGWYLHQAILIQVLPHFAPMQYNTALGALLAAVGILGLVRRRVDIAAVCGGLVLLVGGLTLIEYGFHVDLGLDNLFMQHYHIMVKAPYPGRMAPNTALCYLLAGGALLSGCVAKKYQYWMNIGLVIAFLFGSISFVSLFGYLFHIATAYNWGKLTGMAIHTSTGFLLLAISMVAFWAPQSRLLRSSNNFFFPLLILLFGILIFLLFWHALRVQAVDAGEKDARHETQLIKDNMASLLREKSHAMMRLFERIHHDSYQSPDAIKADAQYYLTHLSSLWVLRVKLGAHNALKSPTFKKSHLSAHRARNLLYHCDQAFEEGSNIGKVGTAQVTTVGDNFCISGQSLRNLAVLNIPGVMDLIGKSVFYRESNVQLTQGGQRVYEWRGLQKSSNNLINYRYHFELFSLPWTVKISRIKGILSEGYSGLSNLFLIFGLLITLLLVFLLRLWQLSQTQNRSLQEAIERTDASEKMLNQVVSNSPDAILIVDVMGKVTFANGAAEQLWGYSNQQLLQKSVEGLMPETYRDKHPQLRAKYLKNPQSRQMAQEQILSILSRTHQEIAVQIALAPIVVDQQACTLCIIKDISANVHYENQIKEQARDIQLIHDATSMAAEAETMEQALQICLDLICQTMGWSAGHVMGVETKEGEACLKSLGVWYVERHEHTKQFKKVTKAVTFSKGEGLAGKALAKRKPVWVAPVQDHEAFPRVKQLPEMQIKSAVALPILIKQQVIAVIELFSNQLKKEEPQALQTFGLLCEQMNRVFERRAVQASLAAAESRNRLLLESAGEGVFGMNLQGKATFVNPAAAKLLGYTVSDLLGQSMHDKVHYAYPDGSQYPPNKSPMLSPLTDGHIQHVTDEVLWHKDGHALNVEYISSPLYDDSKIIGAVVVFNDITKRKQAEEKLIASAEELRLSNQALDDFAYIASHDLKEPLRGIHNFSQFLLEDYGDKLDHNGKDQLQTLQRLSQRMEELINTLLNYSRVGRVDFALQRCDLNAIVEDKLALLANYLKDENATVTIRQKLPTLVCDQARIGEVFQNLITNAVKYNTQKAKEIEIDFTEEPREYIFSVKDNGIGVAVEDYDKVFKIFKRLHRREEYGGGTGAGMTITQKIIERHNGKIWLKSTVGQGSIFYFTLDKNIQAQSEDDPSDNE